MCVSKKAYEQPEITLTLSATAVRIVQSVTACHHCQGTGRIPMAWGHGTYSVACHDCKGSGLVLTEQARRMMA